MEPRVVAKDAFRVVGVEFPDAERRSYLILNLWVALAPKLGLVQRQVEPHVLYGVWYSKPGVDQPFYLVGVRVSEDAEVPKGMAAFTVPASRYVVVTHRGSMGGIAATYEAITRWMRETRAEHDEAATFEVYDTTQPISDEYAVPVCEPIK